MSNRAFLPYQQKWLDDKSQIKIWEKSRRIGATFVQAYEDVRDCVTKAVPAVWFSSADETAAEEYITYCTRWAKAMGKAMELRGVQIVESEDDYQTFRIRFANGTKIVAMSSNPKKFRSKGGKVVLDEFAHHEDALKLWTAAEPTATWGSPIRILSTHNGQHAQFFKMIQQAKAAQEVSQKKITKFSADTRAVVPVTPDNNNGVGTSISVHTTDIYQAIRDGVLHRILRKDKLTDAEIQHWLQEKRANCFDELVWQQEYCCIAVDSATSLITLDTINKAKSSTCLVPFHQLSTFPRHQLYAGLDVARYGDLSVLTIVQFDGQRAIVRYMELFDNATFEIQYQRLCQVIPLIARMNIDRTGIGYGLYERLFNRFGEYSIQSTNFTQQSKEEIAFKVRTFFGDGRLTIPSDDLMIRDIHSLQRSTTASGTIKLSGNTSDSHADRFWSLGLALILLPEIQEETDVPVARIIKVSQTKRGFDL